MRITLFRLGNIPVGIDFWGWETVNGECWQKHLFRIRPQWLVGMVARYIERNA